MPTNNKPTDVNTTIPTDLHDAIVMGIMDDVGVNNDADVTEEMVRTYVTDVLWSAVESR